jgi:triosephosphate isomerase
MRRKLVAGNWKMNGLRSALVEVEALHQAHPSPNCEVVLCPPATLVRAMAIICEDYAITVGGQDCHESSNGAHTGDVSAEMLGDAGAEYIIIGHSERRQNYAEASSLVRAKANSTWDAGLKAIICVGETLQERDAANTLDVVAGQLASSIPDGATGENLVVAYEPIWAIGTGRVPSLNDIGEVHDFIRNKLERRFGPGVGRSTRLLYGGSVNASNASDIFAVSNVDGGLVGGASLKATDFAAIISAL